eukprot:353395-Chlamydomonas_euryale.AAC.2
MSPQPAPLLLLSPSRAGLLMRASPLSPPTRMTFLTKPPAASLAARARHLAGPGCEHLRASSASARAALAALSVALLEASATVAAARRSADAARGDADAAAAALRACGVERDEARAALAYREEELGGTREQVWSRRVGGYVCEGERRCGADGWRDGWMDGWMDVGAVEALWPHGRCGCVGRAVPGATSASGATSPVCLCKRLAAITAVC